MNEIEKHDEFDNWQKLVNTLRDVADSIQRWGVDEEGEHLESLLICSADLTICATMFKEELYARHMYLMLVSQNLQTPWARK